MVKAAIILQSADGSTKTVETSADGSYTFPQLAPGEYTINVSAQGLALAQPQSVSVQPSHATVQNLALIIAIDQQQITVSEQGSGLDTSPDNNAGSIVIKGKDLDALSDDPDELQDELTHSPARPPGPRRPNLYRWLHRRTVASQVFDPRNSDQSKSLFRGVRQARLRPHRDTHQARHRPVARIDHGQRNDSTFNSLNPFVTSEPALLLHFFPGQRERIDQQEVRPGSWQRISPRQQRQIASSTQNCSTHRQTPTATPLRSPTRSHASI